MAQVAGCDGGSAGDRDRTGREKVIEERKKRKNNGTFFQVAKGDRQKGGEEERERGGRDELDERVCFYE